MKRPAFSAPGLLAALALAGCALLRPGGEPTPEPPPPPPLTPAEQAALQVASLRVRPPALDVPLLETYALRHLEVTPLDAEGRPVEGAPVRTLMRSRHATLEDGVIRPFSPGPGELVLTVERPDLPGEESPEPVVVRVPVRVLPPEAAVVDIRRPEGALYAGTTTRLEAVITTAQGIPRDDLKPDWQSNNTRVAWVDQLGFLHARAPGEVRITAHAGGVDGVRVLRVVANPVRSVELEPGFIKTRTGDVVRFETRALDGAGRPVADAPFLFSAQGTAEWRDVGASLYEDGAFVAARPGVYRVLASVGSVSGHAVVEVEARTGALRLVQAGRAPAPHAPTSSLAVFRGNDGRDYAYAGTRAGADGASGKVLAWDVTDPASPVLVDSVAFDGRHVSHVEVNAGATLAVVSLEGSAEGPGGIGVLDLADPAHPTVLGEHAETLAGGVPRSFLAGDLLYAVHGGTRDVHVIDLTEPAEPRDVGRWGLERPGKALHDVWVEQGLAYVSYGEDGLWILDVGDGRRGGTPTRPVPVSHIAFPGTHARFAVPYTNRAGFRYVLVGDGIPACEECTTRAGPGVPGSRGYVHVVSLADVEDPVEVARYEVPEAGVQGVRVEEDRLYAAYGEAGLRVVDVAGELRGDLYAQGREAAWFPTASPDARRPNAARARTVRIHRGHVFVADEHSGLWALRPERREGEAALP